ncbi:spore protease YyaC [Bacillus niameyensis]|uniref:spore protease YyaC n=1 Tax=Bacillus niameyensis TaxID=1522308 RepID=UPI0007801FCB|nr:spore protease YyaC [Bacillus niameyensis]
MKLDPPFNFNKQNEVHVKFDDPLSSSKVSKGILSFLPFDTETPLVIVCIGTDRSTGDSFGPLIGSFLQESSLNNFHVFGTLEDPIHAVNMQEKISYITDQFSNPFIIAIDACLGRVKNIGMLKVGKGPVKPGAGVKKELPSIGHIHLTGVVNVSGYMEFFVLQNTRLNLVMAMAKQVAAGIIKADQLFSKNLPYHLDLDYKKETFL